MTRFVVDASAVLHLASAGVEVSGEHKLLAPTLLRSQCCRLCTRPCSGARSRPKSRATTLPASGGCRSGFSATACSGVGPGSWADRLGWASTYKAEYVALTQLQADAFVTLSRNWRAASKGSWRPRRPDVRR